MKKLLLATSAIYALAVVGPAVAADMPLKAPRPLPPVVTTWTGFYFGANGGYSVARDPVIMTTESADGFPILGAGTPLYGDPREFVLAPRGWNGGVQAGYNFQAQSNWVIGVEADIQANNEHDKADCLLACNARIVTSPDPAILNFFPVEFTDISAEHRLKWFGTVRGRLGFTGGSTTLFYVTGGLAYGSVERSASVVGSTVFAPNGATINTFAGSFNARTTRAGWTAGGGVEGQLWGNWSVKAEYLYIDLGSFTDTFTTFYLTPGGGAAVGDAAATRTDTTHVRDHVFRVGVNYRLDTLPIAARY